MSDGGISLSLRWLFLLMVLAIVSASIGALAALLLRPPTSPAAIEPPAVATTPQTDPQTDAPAPSLPAPVSETAPSPSPATNEAAPARSASIRPQTAPASPPAPPSPEAQTTPPPADTLSPPEAQTTPPPADTLPPLAGGDVPERQRGVRPPAPDLQPSASLPLTLTVTPATVRQGETVVLTVETGEHDGTMTAIVRGPSGRWPTLTLTAYGDQSWGILGVPRDTPLGFYSVTVDLHDPDGRWQQTLTAGLTVRPNEAPLEEIWIGGAAGEVNQEAIQRDHDVRFVEHVTVSGPPRWSGAWLRPVAGEDSGLFGALRMYNGVMGDEWHHGHDIAANHGDSIVASAHGVVVWTGDLALHGLGVILDHGAGVYSGYWHMSLIAVNIGHEVKPGDWLGNIGSTGLSTGPHLHWEVIIQGVDVDPLQWLGNNRPPLPAALTAPKEEALPPEGEQPDEG